MKRATSLCIASAIAIFFVTCKKENQPGNHTVLSNPQLYNSTEEFLTSKRPVPQTFQVSGVEGGTIVGQKGMTVSFPPNSFMLQDGTPVTGTVDILFTEILTPLDMIYNNVFPVAYGEYPLSSGGQFNIQASTNGEPAIMAEGQEFTVTVPAETTDPQMEIFYGQEWSENANGTVDWQDTTYNETDENGIAWIDPWAGYYIVGSDSLMWLNIDSYIPCNMLFSINVIFNGASGFDINNTRIYAFFDGENSVMDASYWATYDGITLHLDRMGDIPMHLLVLTQEEGGLEAGFLAITPEDGETYSMTMSPITPEGFEALVNSFP